MNKFACGKSVLRNCARGFTLSEVMIVLVVIGVITGILLPTAIQSTPDENVMKFKKGYSTLGQVIQELVTSDEYYCNGDLGLYPNCTRKVTSGENTISYFCKTIADLMNVKEEKCYTTRIGNAKIAILLSDEYINHIATGEKMVREVTQETIASIKQKLDTNCRSITPDIGAEIVTTDGIEYFQNGTIIQFGSYQVGTNNINNLEDSISLRYFSPPSQFPANYADKNGFDISYKIYCMDVDGIHPNATVDDCVNECPFGFGIRVDGKILPGARADEWINKSVQKED